MNSIPVRTTTSALLAATTLLGILASPLQARDDRDPGWYDTAELSLVSTSGNSESTTVGFKNKLERIWGNARFTLDLGGIRAEADRGDRFAVGAPGSFRIIDETTSEVTAENFHLRGRYDRDLSERLYWFAGAGWEKNEFAGFDSRLTAIVGAGNRWWNTDRGHFFTDYGLTYTDQDDLIDNPAVDDAFLGLHLGWDFLYNVNESTTFTNVLLLNPNLDESDDWRADMTTSLAVAMSERLALKVSHQLLFDNLPALEALALFDEQGNALGTVNVELEDLDSLFTAALVVKIQ